MNTSKKKIWVVSFLWTVFPMCFVTSGWAAPISPDAATSANLYLWLDAQDSSTIEDGTGNNPGDPGFSGFVAAWRDKANSNDATNGVNSTSQPDYVGGAIGPLGQVAIHFDGGTDDPSFTGASSPALSYRDFLSMPEFMASPNPTVFIVGKTAALPVAGQDNQIFFIDYGNNGTELFVMQGFSGNAANPTQAMFRGAVRDTGADLIPSDWSSLAASDEYFIGAMHVTPSASPSELLRRQVYADGTGQQDLKTNANYNATTWQGTQMSPTLGLNPRGSFNGMLNGDIAELIIFDGNLNAEEYAGVEAYLYEKYFVPEPGTGIMLILAGMALALFHRRRSR